MNPSTLPVNTYTNGILGPSAEMLGPIRSGGIIIANTAPGCWGPMITPEIRGGHEVTQPVAVEGAEPGDAIMIRILSLQITSHGTSSGVDTTNSACALGDPFVAGKCAECGTIWPKTRVEGTGADAIKCTNCGATVSPFSFASGYTMVFDEKRQFGITLHKEEVEEVAKDAAHFTNLPEHSIQHSVTTLAPSDLPGIVSRVKPFLGQLGTCPAVDTPDSHNAGDFGQFLIDAPHDYGVQAEGIGKLTDGHMDINRVREGAVLIAPVRIPGGGVYLGDMHAMQGDGEIAGHTADVAGVAVIEVTLLKDMPIEGPILLPVYEDLPYLSRPLDKSEKKVAKELAKTWNVKLEESLPLSFIGTGATLNEAVDSALSRASNFLDMSVEEVKNRATINGELQIGRYPGTATATFNVPEETLERVDLLDIVKAQYR